MDDWTDPLFVLLAMAATAGLSWWIGKRLIDRLFGGGGR